MAGKIKPFYIRTSPIKREFTQREPVWLLRRDDPDVFFGLANGVVMTGTVYQGADFREEAFQKPIKVKQQRAVQSQGNHYGRTLELTLRYHGALARTAKDSPAQPLTMKAFYHPSGRSMVVAGWDSARRIWVVE